ncbi:CYFA0S25e01024g1_1 [Cyberlindnera fabianii]|uniref:mRNA export factor GLE1 n=1 Tax=Cyberlindnera fabianii TaxID=36022 RepID=A0A061BI70_CYBFA|nr:CYFA0S25e01024g1_1 [Cyberlindnera fabianii]
MDKLNSSFDVSPGYGDSTQFGYDYDASSPSFYNIKSSPLKALDETPTRTPSYRIKRRDRDSHLFQSSPLSKTSSPFATARMRKLHEQQQDAVDVLGELLQDLKFKERYLLVKEQAPHRSHTSRPHSRTSSTNSTRVHTRRPSFQSVDNSFIEQHNDDNDMEKIQDEVVSRLEERLAKRFNAIDIKIRAIEEEKRRIEEEKKRREEEERRKQEAEKKRLEEERIKREQEEKKRKEAEAKAKAEAEKKALAEAEALKKKQEEDAKRAKEQAKKKAQEEAEEAAKKGKGVTNFKEVEAQFLQYKQKIVDIKNDIVLKVKADLPTKNAILKHKRKINPKFGQLTNSMSQLRRISTEVSSMINETRPQEIAYHWILNFVAKAIVSQAETEVRAKPSSSVPLAKLTLFLLCEFAELKEFLMARFVKKCPYVIGYTCAVDTEEGRLRMGWKRHEDSKWEDQVSYDERMAGMMTLYSVITRLPLDQQHFNTMPHPLPMSENWKMLARWMNIKSELLINTHFTVAASWWDASAKEFLMCYGVQGKKLMQIMWTTWPATVEEKKFTGAKTLMTVGEDWSKDGEIKSFGELEP